MNKAIVKYGKMMREKFLSFGDWHTKLLMR